MTVSHNAQTDSYRATYGADTIEGTPERIRVGDVPYVAVRRAIPQFGMTEGYQLLTFSGAAEYSQLILFGKHSTDQAGAPQTVFPMIFFGAETLASDLPSQGIANYPSRVDCTARLDQSAVCAEDQYPNTTAPSMYGSIAADWNTASIKASATLNRQFLGGAGAQDYKIEVDAKLDRSTGSIRGIAMAWALGNLAYTGTVIGQFYGPQAKEVGMIVLFHHDEGRILLVAIGGRL